MWSLGCCVLAMGTGTTAAGTRLQPAATADVDPAMHYAIAA